MNDVTLSRRHTKNPRGGVSVESCSGDYRTEIPYIYQLICQIDPNKSLSFHTTMRPFLVVLLVQSFLVLGRAMPISKELSAEGSHPLVYPLLVANLFSRLQAASFGPAKDGFFPRGVEEKSA
jgi:hypothetical protein